MGFLTDLLRGAVGGAVGFLTGGPAGAIAGTVAGVTGSGPSAPQAQIAAPSPTSLTQASAAILQSPVGGIVKAGLAAITPVQATLQQVTRAAGQELAERVSGGAVAGCPSGKNTVITTVQTFDRDGSLVRSKSTRGSPFLMNVDIVTAKRVFRLVAKASGRLPRKMIKEGKTKQLTDAVMDKALANVITDNGNGGKC